MALYKAVILGIVQGITEFLPISSSGHLKIFEEILNVTNNSLAFSVILHAATVMSILVVFRKDMINMFLLRGNSPKRDNIHYLYKILISAIPIGVIGIFWRDEAERIFNGKLSVVGFMLILTSIILFISYIQKKGNREITYKDAALIGLIQSVAILPGISRAGITIAFALILGINSKKAARFSFLMSLVPIMGAAFFETIDLAGETSRVDTLFIPLLVGFIVAFITGIIACRWMIRIVEKSRFIPFIVYCLLLGIILLIFSI